MFVWAWIAIGGASVLALSVLVALAVAAILGSISRDVSQLLEAAPHGSPPLERTKTTPVRA